MTLNQYATLCHQRMVKWWLSPTTGEPIARNKGELIALMHSEISECFGGEAWGLMDDKLPHRKMGEVELVDALIRMFDYAAGFGHDLDRAASLLGWVNVQDLNHMVNGDCIPPNAFDLYRAVNSTLPSYKALCLIHLEITNLLEHERKNRSTEAATALVKCIVYISAYGNNRGYDLNGAFADKSDYNAKREDHTHEARRVAGGKAF